MRVHIDWLLTPERAAVHLPTGTAVIADLHLGYSGARRRAGEAVPAMGIEEATAGLEPLLARERIARLVIAGDLVEGRMCNGLVQEFMNWLGERGVELGLARGNHDRGLEVEDLGSPNSQVGAWRVAHGDAGLPRGPAVFGHYHPCLRLGGLRAPCFLIGARRIMLPAFSRDASGVNVLCRRWPRGYRCAVIAGEQVLDFGPVAGLSRRGTAAWKRLLRAPRKGERRCE
jgi:putative SbcD/Mre11-related phosphoesterase